jgi:hypothetical protein
MNRNKHNRSFLLLVYACPKVPTHRVVDKNTENNIEIIIKIEIGYILQGQIKKKICAQLVFIWFVPSTIYAMRFDLFWEEVKGGKCILQDELLP